MVAAIQPVLVDTSQCPRCDARGGMYRDIDGFVTCATCGYHHYRAPIPKRGRMVPNPAFSGQVELVRYSGESAALKSRTVMIHRINGDRLHKALAVRCPICIRRDTAMSYSTQRGVDHDGERLLRLSFVCPAAHRIYLMCHPQRGWLCWE